MRTVLNSAHDAAGAQFCAYHGWEIPENFGSVETEYQALRRAAGIVDLSFRGKLVATGEDRARFLQGMLSNDIEQLQPGQGNYCFLLNAQGHILADLNVEVPEGVTLPERVRVGVQPRRDVLADASVASLRLHDLDAASVEALLADLAAEFPSLALEHGPAAAADHDVLVNATPVGMAAGDPLPFDLSDLGPNTALADVILRPEVSPMLELGRAKGCITQTGHDMARAQAGLIMEHLGLA